MKIYDDETLKLLIEVTFGTSCEVKTEFVRFAKDEIVLAHIIDLPLAPINLKIHSFTSNKSLDNYYMIGDDFIDNIDELKEGLKNLLSKAYELF